MDLRCTFCGQPSCPPCPEADAAMQCAVDRYHALLNGLLGKPQGSSIALPLIALGVLSELPDEEARALDAVAARLQDALAAYVYTVPDVAARLGISARAVHHLVRRGELSGTPLHGQWRFTEAQIACYLAPGGTPAAADATPSCGQSN